MAFYILLKGKVSPFKFNYLSDLDQPRLDPTVIHGKPQVETKEVVNSELPRALSIMKKNLYVASPATSLTEALDLCKKKKIHHLPIVLDGSLKGIISDRDLLANLSSKKYLHEIMNETVVACSEETSIKHLAQVMNKEDISALPVVDDHLKVTGIVTHRDILNWIIVTGLI